MVELLTETERAILSELGIDLQSNALAFQHRLNELEMRRLWRLLVSLKNRMVHEDDGINFVMGDWLNQAEEWFGEDIVRDWIAEEGRLRLHMDYLLKLVGATLIQLQRLEYTIKGCCAFLFLKGLKLTVSDFLSPDPRHRKQTLGQLANALVVSEIFEADFENRLTSFTRKRNQFIHRLWVDTQEEVSGSDVLLFTTLEQIEEFVLDLFRETFDLQEVFIGFYYAIGAKLAEREGAVPELDSILREWAQQILAFAAVQRRADENP